MFLTRFLQKWFLCANTEPHRIKIQLCFELEQIWDHIYYRNGGHAITNNVYNLATLLSDLTLHEVTGFSLHVTRVQSLANISRLFRCSRAAPCRRDGPCRWTPRSCQSWRYSAASLDHSWRPYWGRGIPRGPRPSPLSRKHTADCRHPIHEQNPEKTHHILKRYVHQDVNTVDIA